MPESTERRWTVGELAAAGADVFGKNGLESPRLESDLLLAEALGWKRLDLFTKFDMPVTPEARGRFRDFVRRRLTREPVAYILGRREFLSWTFDVTPDVLIPRPETEHLVEAGVERLRGRGGERRVLEVGVGSGCVLVSILLTLPEVRGCGLDVSEPAIAVARGNARRHGVEERIDWVADDVFAWLARGHAGAEFDLVVCNPPYVTDAERGGLEADARDFEPPHALFWPGDGLDFHRRLLREGRSLLAPGGVIAMELPGQGGEELSRLAREELGAVRCDVGPDLAGRDRVIVVDFS